MNQVSECECIRGRKIRASIQRGQSSRGGGDVKVQHAHRGKKSVSANHFCEKEKKNIYKKKDITWWYFVARASSTALSSPRGQSQQQVATTAARRRPSLSDEASRRQPVAKLDIRFLRVKAQPHTHPAHAIGGGGAGDASQGSSLQAQVQEEASADVPLVAVSELGDAVYCAKKIC